MDAVRFSCTHSSSQLELPQEKSGQKKCYFQCTNHHTTPIEERQRNRNCTGPNNPDGKGCRFSKSCGWNRSPYF